MKFNLKHRPKYEYKFSGPKAINRVYEEWFEGFEKELRERKNEWISTASAYRIIKEILGETP